MNDLDQAQKAALHAQAECLKAQDFCLKAQEGEREALRKRAEAEAYAEECLAALREAKWHLLGKPMCNLESLLEAIEAVLNRESEIGQHNGVVIRDPQVADDSAAIPTNPVPAVGTIQRLKCVEVYYAGQIDRAEMKPDPEGAYVLWSDVQPFLSQVSKQEPTP